MYFTPQWCFWLTSHNWGVDLRTNFPAVMPVHELHITTILQIVVLEVICDVTSETIF